jgi:hypothetical protein
MTEQTLAQHLQGPTMERGFVSCGQTVHVHKGIGPKESNGL